MGESRAAVYEAVVSFIYDFGFSPTVREVGEIVGLSAATVQVHLEHLVNEGFLQHEDGKPRTLRLGKS